MSTVFFFFKLFLYHIYLSGGNVLREAIDLLQLEKIENLKNQNEEAENKILDLEKDIQNLQQDRLAKKLNLQKSESSKNELSKNLM